MSDGLGILLALAAVVAPLVLAWYLLARTLGPREPDPHRKHKR